MTGQNRRWSFVLFFLVIAFIGMIGLNHMGANEQVSRSWAPYVTAIGVFGTLASLSAKSRRPSDRTKNKLDEINDNGRFGSFGPTTSLGIDQSLKDIRAGR
jgi:hypothetical protein